MTSCDMPSTKAPNATARPIDLEYGNRDQITPSASSSLTPDEPRSKAVTPTLRRSLEIEDAVPRHRTFHTPRIWTKLEAKLPTPLSKSSRKVVNWIKGPAIPRTYSITPFFERVQTLPARLLARLPQWARLGIYVVAFIVWAVIFGVILTNYSLPSNIGGFGAPVALSCVTNLWYVLYTDDDTSMLTDLQAQRSIMWPRRSKLSAFCQLFLRIQLSRRLP
jgi:hypothetical protein